MKKQAPKGRGIGRRNRLNLDDKCEVFSCRLPPSMHDNIRDAATEFGVIKSDLVRIIFEGWLNEYGPNKKL